MEKDIVENITGQIDELLEAAAQNRRELMAEVRKAQAKVDAHDRETAGLKTARAALNGTPTPAAQSSKNKQRAAQRKKERARVKKQIVAKLADGPMPMSELPPLLGVSTGMVRNAVAELEKEEKIARRRKSHGDSQGVYTELRLADKEPEPHLSAVA